VLIIQLIAGDKKSEAEKQSAADSTEGTAKPFIMSLSAQVAVERLPHIAQAPTITRQALTLLYSLIEGEHAAPPPSP